MTYVLRFATWDTNGRKDSGKGRMMKQYQERTMAWLSNQSITKGFKLCCLIFPINLEFLLYVGY